MPSGHTNKETINERRKLTPGMLRLLRYLAVVPSCGLNQFSASQKNQARALCDRGLAEYVTRKGGSQHIVATLKGLATVIASS